MAMAADFMRSEPTSIKNIKQLARKVGYSDESKFLQRPQKSLRKKRVSLSTAIPYRVRGCGSAPSSMLAISPTINRHCNHRVTDCVLLARPNTILLMALVALSTSER
jgi:hypothetical protein